MQSLYCRTALKSADKHAAGQGSPAAAAAVFRQVAPSEFSKNDELNSFLRYALQQQLFLNAAPYICAAQIQSANAVDHKIPSASPCQTVYNSQH